MGWGKKMSSKQFEDLYQRMQHKDKKKIEEIKRQREEKKNEDLEGCTFKPQLMAKPFKRSKSPKDSLNIIKNKIKSKFYSKKLLNNVSEIEKPETKSDDKFLKRIEEMKKRDEERKAATKKKYDEYNKKQFEQKHTFQPNKNLKKKKNRSRSNNPFNGSSEEEEEEIDDINHFLNKQHESGVVLGLDELLNQERPEIQIKKNKNYEKTGDKFLDRMQKYTKEKIKKEKQNEIKKKQLEDDQIKYTCTFQPNKNQ